MTRSASAAAATHRRSLPQWESAASREANQAIAFGRSSLLAPSTPPISDKLPETTAAWGFAPMTSIRRRSSREVRMAAQNPVAGQLPPHLASLLGPVVPLQPEKLDAALARFMMVEGPCIHTLLLRDNRLEELPSLSHLPSLKLLDLSNNLFMHIPDSLGTCSLLHTLKLSHNLLGGEGPFNEQTLAALHALTDLDISNNEITELPHYIGVLKKLKVLRVERNALQTLPRDLFSIPSLTTLTASYNILTALPVEMGSAPSLTKLALDNNRISAKICKRGMQYIRHFMHSNAGGLGEEALATVLGQEGAERASKHSSSKLASGQHPAPAPDVSDPAPPEAAPVIKSVDTIDEEAPQAEALPAAPDSPQDEWPEDERPVFDNLGTIEEDAPHADPVPAAPDSPQDEWPEDERPVSDNLGTIEEDAPHADPVPAAPDSPQDEWPEDERPASDNFESAFPRPPNNAIQPAGRSRLSACEDAGPAFPPPTKNAIQPAGRSRLSACENAGPSFKGVLSPEYLGLSSEALNDASSAKIEHGKSSLGEQSPDRLRRFDSAPTPGLASKPAALASASKPGAPSKGSEAEMLKSMAPSWDSPNCPKCTSNLFHVEQIGECTSSVLHTSSTLSKLPVDMLIVSGCQAKPIIASSTSLKPVDMLIDSGCQAKPIITSSTCLKPVDMLIVYGCQAKPIVTSSTSLKPVEMLDISGCQAKPIITSSTSLKPVDMLIVSGCQAKPIITSSNSLKPVDMLDVEILAEPSATDAGHKILSVQLFGNGHKILSVQLEKEKVDRELELAKDLLSKLIAENHLNTKEIKANRLAIELREARGEAQGFQKRTEEAEEQLGVERARSNAAASVAGGSERNAQKAGELAAQVSEQAADIERLHKLAASHLSQYCEAEDRCLNAEARSDAMIGQMDGLQGEVGHLKTEVQIQIKKAVLENLEARQSARTKEDGRLGSGNDLSFLSRS
eukprot:gene1680-33076_t